MTSILAVLLLLALAHNAEAGELVAKNGSDYVRLHERSCEHEAITPRLGPLSREHYQAASSVVNGKKYAACWADPGGQIHLIYEDGDQGLIPARDFKEEVGI